MNLHNDKKLFKEAIEYAAQALKIKPVFIEKDYWICHVLWKLSQSGYNEKVVFKGGTSLSKGHQLIKRFSEDIDLAIIDIPGLSGNRIKELIRTIEKEITSNLHEKIIEGITSKGSRFRKTVFEYPTHIRGNQSNMLLIEINLFANPVPFAKHKIESFIAKFFKEHGNPEVNETYVLHPFEVNVLDFRQTMVEKLVSLVRFSFEDNAITGIKSKIRHFYDLHFLVQSEKGKTYLESGLFKENFKKVLAHDRQAFDVPDGWQNKNLDDSDLIKGFSSVWDKIKNQYTSELSALAYVEIPPEGIVAESFKKIIKRLDKI